MTGHDLSAGPDSLADRSDAQRKLDAAVIATAQLLTETGSAVTPSTPPQKLLTTSSATACTSRP